MYCSIIVLQIQYIIIWSCELTHLHSMSINEFSYNNYTISKNFLKHNVKND